MKDWLYCGFESRESDKTKFRKSLTDRNDKVELHLIDCLQLLNESTATERDVDGEVAVEDRRRITVFFAVDA